MDIFKQNWWAFIFISAFIIGFPFFTISYFDINKANSFLLKYLLLPLLLGTIIYSYRFHCIYVKRLKYRDPNRIRGFLESFFSILLFGLTLSAIIYGILFSLIITINANIGHQEKVLIKENVLGYTSSTTKNGRLRHYIEIFEPRNKDTINLEVYRQYEVNEVFEKEMCYGSFNMLYSKK